MRRGARPLALASAVLRPHYLRQPTRCFATSPYDHGLNPKVPKDISWLLESNRRWVEFEGEADATKISRASNTPSILWIGCADSRVPAETVCGHLELGTLFVHRNIANLALGNDMNCMSVLQYAVENLQVQHIVVCGHYDCGGVKAAATNTYMQAPLDNWLRNIRDVIRTHKKELDALETDAARHRRLVELNVIEQCINIFKTGTVQRRRLETFQGEHPYTQPRIHAMVYDPADGRLHRMPIDWDETLDELGSIYQFRDVDSLTPGGAPKKAPGPPNERADFPRPGPGPSVGL